MNVSRLSRIAVSGHTRTCSHCLASTVTPASSEASRTGIPTTVTQNQKRRPVIPKKIKRSSTAILEALASTVGEDPTGYGYEFIDDPYLLPHKHFDRQLFESSSKMGEQAADVVLNQVPELLTMWDTSLPRIDSFHPKVIHSSMEKNSNEKQLAAYILAQDVERAITAFEASLEEGVDLSDDILSDVVDLLAFHGNVPRVPIPEAIKRASQYKEYKRMVPTQEAIEAGLAEEDAKIPYLDEDSPAMKAFNMIKEKTAQNFAAIIMSQVKYGLPDEAFKLYRIKVTEGMIFEEAVHNAILACFAESGERDYGEFAIKVLVKMRDTGVKPTVETFNNVMRHLPSVQLAHELVPPLMSEMNQLGIQKNLATYGHLFRLALFSSSERPQHDADAAPAARARLLTPFGVHLLLSQSLTLFHQRPQDGVRMKGQDDVIRSDVGLVSADDLLYLPMAMACAMRLRDRDTLSQQLVDIAVLNPHLLSPDEALRFYARYFQVQRFYDAKDMFSSFSRIVPNRHMLRAREFQSLLERSLADVSRSNSNLDSSSNDKGWIDLPGWRVYMVTYMWMCVNNNRMVYREQSLLETLADVMNRVDMAEESSESKLAATRFADEILSLTSTKKDMISVKLSGRLRRSLVVMFTNCDRPERAVALIVAHKRDLGLTTQMLEALLSKLHEHKSLSTAIDLICHLAKTSSQDGQHVKLYRMLSNAFGDTTMTVLQQQRLQNAGIISPKTSEDMTDNEFLKSYDYGN